MSNIDLSRAERLDQRVVALLPQLSRAFAVRLITEGKVSVNGKTIVKAGTKVRTIDEVFVDYDVRKLEQIPSIDLPILYEDDDCVVIDKPVGVLTHSKGVFNAEATVASFLRSKVQNLSGERAGIVHRLDRMTSGVIMGAKHQTALTWLQKQFAQRKVKKTYVAIVAGHVQPQEAVIDMPIGRNPKAPATFRVDANGKSAITHYKVLQTTERYNLVELRPETGRTHQLRVHLRHIGHPIIGDELYAGQIANRLYLHALRLEITLPNHTRQEFEAPLPKAFKQFMEMD